MQSFFFGYSNLPRCWLGLHYNGACFDDVNYCDIPFHLYKLNLTLIMFGDHISTLTSFNVHNIDLSLQPCDPKFLVGLTCL